MEEVKADEVLIGAGGERLPRVLKATVDDVPQAKELLDIKSFGHINQLNRHLDCLVSVCVDHLWQKSEKGAGEYGVMVR